MYIVKRLMAWLNDEGTPQGNSRQFKIINTISIELIILGFVLIYINISWQLWLLFYLDVVACALAAINLMILNKTKNTVICGNFLTLLALAITIVANYWMGGLSSSFFGWFYVIPILAAVTINWIGLIVYAGISLAMVVVFAMLNITPIYTLTPSNELVMNFLNRFFSLFVIVSTLYSVLRENIQYEKMLREHNYLLQADKDKFHYLARYDTLTNLPNRSYFQTYAQAIIESAQSKNHCVTVFFMDLDRLKEVNDHYGHDAGDALILQAGKRLQTCFRESDFLARLGGDEFTAIINHLKEDKIPITIATRILQEFNKPFEIATEILNCTISIGLATYPLDTLNTDELIKKADQAMYSAKKAGGNTYRFLQKTNNLFSKNSGN